MENSESSSNHAIYCFRCKSFQQVPLTSLQLSLTKNNKHRVSSQCPNSECSRQLSTLVNQQVYNAAEQSQQSQQKS